MTLTSPKGGGSRGSDEPDKKRGRFEWTSWIPFVTVMLTILGAIWLAANFLRTDVASLRAENRELREKITALEKVQKTSYQVAWDVRLRVEEIQVQRFEEFQQSCFEQRGVFDFNQKACKMPNGSAQRFRFVSFNDFLWPTKP